MVISISLNDFILNIRTYKGEVDDALTVFVEKFDDGTVRDQPSNFRLTSDEIKLNRGYVEIVDENIENQKPIFFKKPSGYPSKVVMSCSGCFSCR